MKDNEAQPQTTAAQAELDRLKARNDKLSDLLLKMERLWPDEEKGAVRSLMAQTEATESVLQNCSERLGKLK